MALVSKLIYFGKNTTKEAEVEAQPLCQHKPKLQVFQLYLNARYKSIDLEHFLSSAVPPVNFHRRQQSTDKLNLPSCQVFWFVSTDEPQLFQSVVIHLPLFCRQVFLCQRFFG